ncbi:MAG: hypothetical protein H8K03_01745 [Nitrospira sp.]|jgi:hypothetical protein|nr:hypothetical protein [Nitrospira sp. BO4]
MQPHHWLQDKISHKVDKMGIAVALAILIGIGLFAGSGVENSAGEGPPARSAHMATEQMSNIEKTGTVPYSDNRTDQKPGVNSSHR